MNPNAYLILDDGSTWPGESFGTVPPAAGSLPGKEGEVGGEVVFNTCMTGYHEILTDPSYTGQIVMMTYPHIGNYGADDEWTQSGSAACRGLVVRSVHTGPVPKGRLSLDDFLKREGVCGISGLDTRALTLRFREKGSANGVIVGASDGVLSGDEPAAVTDYLKGMPSMTGRTLAAEAGRGRAECLNPEGSPRVALLDCGVKEGILRELTGRGCRVDVLPAGSTARDVRNLGADALLFSNGPGDPEPLEGPIAMAGELMGSLPLWGICLGHQILSLAAGASTYKMGFGHHGGNHPVRDVRTGRVFVTSQNHGFAVDASTLPEGFEARFFNANDGSLEGVECRERNVLCVQHHPEASPGPADSAWVFDMFLSALKKDSHAG